MMNFDPVSYAIHRTEINADRVRQIEHYLETLKVERARTETRIEALEAWKMDISGYINRWPMVLGVVILIALNWAPKETAKAVVAAIEALT